MLALEPGGYTQGIALRLAQATMYDDLRITWIREMVLGSYKPTWAPLTLDDGTQTHAIAFVADPSQWQYEADSSVATVAPLVMSAAGTFGSNAEYVYKLQAALGECALRDPYIEELVGEVRRLFRQVSYESSATPE